MTDDEKYYDGPEPTLEERQKVWQWIVEYLKKFPESDLKKDYPYLYLISIASKRYDEINLLRYRGLMDENEYQTELDKVLPLISADLTGI